MNDVLPILFTLWLSILGFAASLLMQPTTAQCPTIQNAYRINDKPVAEHWFISNVTPDGYFTCARPPSPLIPEIDCSGAKACPGETLPPGELYGKIYCTGGVRAIWTSVDTVGCMR